MLSDKPGVHKLSYFNYLKWKGHIETILNKGTVNDVIGVKSILLTNIEIEINTTLSKMQEHGIIEIADGEITLIEQEES